MLSGDAAGTDVLGVPRVVVRVVGSQGGGVWVGRWCRGRWVQGGYPGGVGVLLEAKPYPWQEC